MPEGKQSNRACDIRRFPDAFGMTASAHKIGLNFMVGRSYIIDNSVFSQMALAKWRSPRNWWR
jgi:hypothetical protein